MIVIQGRNVNDIYSEATVIMEKYGRRDDSRNGGVLAAPYPVMTVYERPTERVLFNSHRNANPFFHFFESLWMLAGRNDARWLDRFVKDFSSRFAEDNGIQWGAYGHRWRESFGYDQLDVVVEKLRVAPLDRRVVISMWDPHYDLDSEQYTESGLPARDVPCNTQIYPRIVDGALDITVMCRSNDVVWGAYGANAVHFSFLQEYLSARIGVPVGKMYQLSNNWHLYNNVADKFVSDPAGVAEYPSNYPLVEHPESFDAELNQFLHDPTACHGMKNTFFGDVAYPMWIAHDVFRQTAGRVGIESALYWSNSIRSEDWALAVRQWLQRKAK